MNILTLLFYLLTVEFFTENCCESIFCVEPINVESAEYIKLGESKEIPVHKTLYKEASGVPAAPVIHPYDDFALPNFLFAREYNKVEFFKIFTSGKPSKSFLDLSQNEDKNNERKYFAIWQTIPEPKKQQSFKAHYWVFKSEKVVGAFNKQTTIDVMLLNIVDNQKEGVTLIQKNKDGWAINANVHIHPGAKGNLVASPNNLLLKANFSEPNSVISITKRDDAVIAVTLHVLTPSSIEQDVVDRTDVNCKQKTQYDLLAYLNDMLK